MENILMRSIIAAGVFVTLSTSAVADNSWNGYHWASKESPIVLQVVDSVSADWQSEMTTSLSKWNQSQTFNMLVTSTDDGSRARKRCRMVAGQMRVCNASYGNNGWLGLASIGLNSNGHIDQGTAKVNDTYASYWQDQAEKNHVMCQEIGHVFGLDHTSTDGSSQGTCMDYSNSTNSQWPNAHDYQMLDNVIYNHLDSYNSYDDGSGSGDDPCNAPPGKGCNKFPAPATPMGVLIHRGNKHEIWVANRPDGGLWIHHVLLAPKNGNGQNR